MENKKKGFWASLFSPKPCKCSCGAYQIPAEEAAVSTQPSDAGAVREVKVLNLGIGGNCVVEGGLSQPALQRFDRDILGQHHATRLILFEGTNDIGLCPKGQSEQVVDRLISAYVQLIDKCLRWGYNNKQNSFFL